jgi:hypothetical protein
MREHWSEHDKRAKEIAEDAFSWEQSETDVNDEDVLELKETLEGRKTEYQSAAKRPIYRQEIRDDRDESASDDDDSESEFIGCPDSNSFDPDI